VKTWECVTCGRLVRLPDTFPPPTGEHLKKKVKSNPEAWRNAENICSGQFRAVTE
jgi:hypothetical protein